MKHPDRPRLGAVIGLLLATGSIVGADGLPWAELPWDALLAQAQLSRATAQLEPGRWRAGGSMTLKAFDVLWDDWFQLQPYALASTEQALPRAGALLPAIGMGSAWLDVELSTLVLGTAQTAAVRRGKEPGTLAGAVAAIHRRTGVPLDHEQFSELQQQARCVPAPVAQAAALLLFASEKALDRRDRALRDFCAPGELLSFFQRVVSFADRYDLEAETLAQLERVDLYRQMVGREA